MKEDLKTDVPASLERKERGEVLVDELEQREGLTIEEKKFALGVRDTVSGWLKEPIQIAKFGLDYQRNELAIEYWYQLYKQGQFSNPYRVKNEYEYTLSQYEGEIRKFFSSPYGFGIILPSSLISNEELEFIRRQGLDNYDLVERVDPARVRQVFQEIHERHRQEFERLRANMVRFNAIAAKMNRAEDARKAVELGIPLEDYRFVVDYEILDGVFTNSRDPRATKDWGKCNALFYFFWEKGIGLPVSILIGRGQEREKGDETFEALSSAAAEEQLRALIQGNPYQLQILEELKSGSARFKELTAQYREHYAARQVRGQFARELELPSLN
jgi:hypothetical protein